MKIRTILAPDRKKLLILTLRPIRNRHPQQPPCRHRLDKPLHNVSDRHFSLEKRLQLRPALRRLAEDRDRRLPLMVELLLADESVFLDILDDPELAGPHVLAHLEALDLPGAEHAVDPA